jgi:hypothetical protein
MGGFFFFFFSFGWERVFLQLANNHCQSLRLLCKGYWQRNRPFQSHSIGDSETPKVRLVGPYRASLIETCGVETCLLAFYLRAKKAEGGIHCKALNAEIAVAMSR